jgi:hypothetical protein
LLLLLLPMPPLPLLNLGTSVAEVEAGSPPCHPCHQLLLLLLLLLLLRLLLLAQGQVLLVGQRQRAAGRQVAEELDLVHLVLKTRAAGQGVPESQLGQDLGSPVGQGLAAAP